eukprot:10728117-Ditylum_brightwellii.AAC.1
MSGQTIRIFVIVAIVMAICKHYQIRNEDIIVACDGLSAIRKAMSEDTNYSCRSKHVDLISGIDFLVCNSSKVWKWRWVERNQEKFYNPLDRLASLNIDMDSAAKQRWGE